MNISSPCNGICKINHQSGLCMGCWRTIDEIIAWRTYSDETKNGVWGLIALRKNQTGDSGSNPADIDLP